MTLLYFLFAAIMSFTVVVKAYPDESVGGSRYTTSHACLEAISRENIDYHKESEIKEFHFHTYFHLFENAEDCPKCNSSYLAAERLRNQLIQAVRDRDFVAVLHGVDESILPGLKTNTTFPVNMHPQGPHPIGSFETWVPKEYLAPVMSFFMIHRQYASLLSLHLFDKHRKNKHTNTHTHTQNHRELSIFFHPLSSNAIEDHIGRSAFLGEPMALNLNVIEKEGDPPQYPELGLGYSAESGVPSYPGQWWRHK